jgi:hypothetical protein
VRRDAVPAPEAAPGAGEDDSGTNVQEIGVDEPDVVKSAGGLIFVVAGGNLNAIRANGLDLLGSLPLDGWDHQLLLRGERLLVISQATPLTAAPPRGDEPAIGFAPDFLDEVTQLTEIDVSNPSAMRVVRTERVRGRHVSSRLTGRTARVVIWTRPRAVIEPRFRSSLRGWLPRRVLRRPAGGKPVFHRTAPCRRVMRPALYSGIDMLTVLTIDLSKGLPAVDSDAIMSGGQTVYASNRSLYVATPKWAATFEDGAPPRSRTQIHRFDASNPDATTYRASGDVPGYLLNQFAMSEHEGVLRVASTTLPAWAGGEESESAVTTLAQRGGALATLGQVGGLGKGERIYAVRFIGDAGYVVTFRQIDPLFVVDLEKPSAPVVRGELELRGFSAYLHPLGGGLLLGVGQDANDRGGQLGTQLSLFDVSDPSSPRRLAHATIAGASSDAEFDHHAFLWWGPSKLAVLPLSTFSSRSGDWWSGAVGFRVEREGIGEAGRAEHTSAGYPAPVHRALVVRGRLYTISDAAIEQNDLATLAQQDELAFPQAREPEPGPIPLDRPTAP